MGTVSWMMERLFQRIAAFRRGLFWRTLSCGGEKVSKHQRLIYEKRQGSPSCCSKKGSKSTNADRKMLLDTITVVTSGEERPINESPLPSQKD